MLLSYGAMRRKRRARSVAAGAPACRAARPVARSARLRPRYSSVCGRAWERAAGFRAILHMEAFWILLVRAAAICYPIRLCSAMRMRGITAAGPQTWLQRDSSVLLGG